ncbi:MULTISPECIES: hypothetical protein [unclassified Brevibacterium]|uniref:hypothetical protein n=1 Tax=unclassified Brevibacterium TaxID=2614124 RepID=UPI001091A654|nr:hypothetical protein [Brevibacterium sp. S22]TGD32705.1 hypothetical protein EB835_03265 [Brevibacterium sp. S22]
MSMWHRFASLKIRILRHGPHGDRAFGLIAGLVVAAAVVTSAALVSTGTVDDSWLTAAVSILGLTWLLGPILLPGAVPVLNPQWFRTLPTPPSSIAAAMSPSELLSVGTVVTGASLSSFVVVAAGHDGITIIAAFAAAVAQLFFLVWLGRSVGALVAFMLRTRLGGWVAAFQMSALLAVSFAGWVPVAAFLIPDLGSGRMAAHTGSVWTELPDQLEHALLIAPTGWGLAAVRAAMTSGPLASVLLPLGGLLVLGLLLWTVWMMLTAAALRQPPAQVGSRIVVRTGQARFNRGDGDSQRPDPMTAVAKRELKTWLRDPQRSLELRHAWMTPLLMMLLVAPTAWSWSLPFIGVAAAVFAAMVAINTYALDGTAVWQLLTTPGAVHADVRGRQLAWMLMFGFPIIVVTTILGLVADSSLAYVAMGAVLAAVGAACACAPLLSALMPAIGRDARERISTGQNAGNPAGGQMMSFTFVLFASALPGILAAVLQLEDVWAVHLGFGLAVLMISIAAAGPLTVKRLTIAGPELLASMKSV